MRSLFKPSTQRGYLTVVGPKRATKTLAALYRILSDDFARRRAHECTCRMPMIFEAERGEPQSPNWRVEALWCGSIDCQYALSECVALHAKLYDLADSDAPDSGWEATGGF